MNRYLRFFIFVGLFGASLIPSLQAKAASQPTPQGITITPAFQQVSIPVGVAQQPISFSVTNNESRPQALSLSTADFNTLNESGGLFFVGTNPTALQKKYGLAKWISLGQTQLNLAPKQTATIRANILNLPDLTPGGHYGALMVSAQTSNSQASSAPNKVALHPIASSLLFVTKLGGDTHKLGLSSVTIRRHIFSMPNNVILRFHNDGNTHLILRGTVTITNSSGKLISKGIINEESAIILPETYRQYFVPLQQLSSATLPGRYKISADFRFDGISEFRSYQQSIFYMPFYWLVIMILLLCWVVIIIVRRLKPRNK